LIGGSLASALGKVGTAASEAATSAVSAAGDLGGLAKSLATLANPLTAALGILEAAAWLRKNTHFLDPEPGGSDKYQSDKNSQRRFQNALRDQRRGIPGLPEYDPRYGEKSTMVPYGPQRPLTLDSVQHALAGGDDLAASWIRGFNIQAADLPQSVKDAVTMDLSPQGANAGHSFGQAFLQTVLEYIRRIGPSLPKPGGGAVTPGPDGYLGDYTR
jgi:hypothetical protein